MKFNNKKLINKELSGNDLIYISGGKGKKNKDSNIGDVLKVNSVNNDFYVSTQAPISKNISTGPYVSINKNTGKVNGGGMAFTWNFH